jgi:hypothetical protein
VPITRWQMALARRSPDWGPDDPDAVGSEDLIESSGELGVTISDQELDRRRPLGQLGADVAGLPTLDASATMLLAGRSCLCASAWKARAKTGEDGPVGRFERRSCDLAAQDGNLVTQQRVSIASSLRSRPSRRMTASRRQNAW